jgi:hypothetical protein
MLAAARGALVRGRKRLGVKDGWVGERESFWVMRWELT